MKEHEWRDTFVAFDAPFGVSAEEAVKAQVCTCDDCYDNEYLRVRLSPEAATVAAHHWFGDDWVFCPDGIAITHDYGKAFVPLWEERWYELPLIYDWQEITPRWVLCGHAPSCCEGDDWCVDCGAAGECRTCAA